MKVEKIDIQESMLTSPLQYLVSVRIKRSCTYKEQGCYRVGIWQFNFGLPTHLNHLGSGTKDHWVLGALTFSWDRLT